MWVWIVVAPIILTIVSIAISNIWKSTQQAIKLAVQLTSNNEKYFEASQPPPSIKPSLNFELWGSGSNNKYKMGNDPQLTFYSHQNAQPVRLNFEFDSPVTSVCCGPKQTLFVTGKKKNQF